MADNITITSGTGVTVATDDDGSAQHQYVKVEFGADGAFTKVTNAVPLPISGTTIAITSLPAFAVGSSVTISNLAATPLTVSGTTIAITSLPAFAVGAITSISNLSFTISNLSTLPLTISGTTIAITSLPSLGFGGLVSISNGAILSVTNLLSITGTVTSLGGTSATQVTISNLASVPLTVSGTTIAITSLPALGFGGLVSCSNGQIVSLSAGALISVSNLYFTVSNLASVPITVSGTTIAITSLPNLGVGSILSINNLTVNTSISTSIGNFPVQNISAKTYWRLTATQAAASTILIKAETGSQTAIYITDVIISNENTAGNASLIESNRSIVITPVLERLYFAANGGAVMNFAQPLACNTNTTLYLLTRTATNLSIFIQGFTGLEAKSL